MDEAAQVGGAIKDSRKKSRRMIADPVHHRLIHKLSGKGARFDSPRTRRTMSHLLQHNHPDLHKAYFSGRVPKPEYHHQFHQYQKNTDRPDVESDVTDYGGSLLPISHFEMGIPVVHNSDYHPHFEIV